MSTHTLSKNLNITIIFSQYDRISGGNRALFEYANRLHAIGHNVKLYILARPTRWYRIDHWKRILNKTVEKISPEEIDWMDKVEKVETKAEVKKTDDGGAKPTEGTAKKP